MQQNNVRFLPGTTTHADGISGLFSVQPEFGWESPDAICKPTVLVLIRSVTLFPDLPSGSI